MPYIKQNRRDQMGRVLSAMIHTQVKADGDLNYVLYKYCKESVVSSYNNYKNYIAELRQCATEIERRILAPYEDKKLEENGDV